MLQKDQLTNEALKKHFHDNFELAQFTINVARYLIKSGHEVDIPHLLKEIQRDPTAYTPENLALLDKEDEDTDSQNG